MNHPIRVPVRSGSATFLLAMLLAAATVGCDRAGSPGRAESEILIDGEPVSWVVTPGDGDSPGDGQFRRHGVATGVQLNAHDGGRKLELFAQFLGQPSEPVFLEQKVSYTDAEGVTFERVGPRGADDGESGIRWERIEIDEETGTGFASAVLDLPVCVDVYSGPLEYETRCRQVSGTFRAPLVHSPRLRVIR